MADHDLDILDASMQPGSEIYPNPLDVLLTLTNVKSPTVWFVPFPTGTDVTMEGTLVVPQEYASDPRIVAIGVIDGTPASTFAVTAQQVEVAESGSVDVAYEAEDTASNATWTGYADEDIYSIEITLTPSSAYTPGREVNWKWGRDDSVDTTTFNFILQKLLFRFSDT